MYFITLTTDEELTDDEFQEVFGLLDNSFDVGTVLTFSADGEKIETVATMSTKHDKYLYEFDVANKIATTEGDNVVLSLAKVVACDFELDAPIIEDECSMKIKDVEEAVDPEELEKAMKKPPLATNQSATTKDQIQAYKDKRYGTRDQQKAKSDKAGAEVRKIVKDAGPWTSGSSVPGGSLD